MSEDFVIDTSVVMSWCFKDETNRYADGILDLLEEATALAPSIWPLEVGNVLLVAERRKRLSGADSMRFITLLAYSAEVAILIRRNPTLNSGGSRHPLIGAKRRWVFSPFS